METHLLPDDLIDEYLVTQRQEAHFGETGRFGLGMVMLLLAPVEELTCGGYFVGSIIFGNEESVGISFIMYGRKKCWKYDPYSGR